MPSKTTNADRLKAYRNKRYAVESVQASIYDFLLALNCPRSLTVWLMYTNGEHEQLVNLECDSESYPSGLDFRAAYAATNFLQKASFLKPGFDKKQRALEKFRLMETHCGNVNKRFRDLASDPLYSGPNVPLLSAMVRKIDSILTTFDSEEFVDGADWGPGSSTILSGAEVSGFNKFRDERGITRDMYRLVRPWFHVAYPQWSRLPTVDESLLDGVFKIEAGNKVVTVPKNSKTDRVIAIEPGFNIWFQKSIGSMIRRRLLRCGIDLNSQLKNQELCRVGAIYDDLATVDFSSASDSISKQVVRTLIRDQRWLSLLEASRSRYGRIGDSTFKWNKFSSMGNGFTFELESLIFYAAAMVVCEYNGDRTDRISVFGDDVIIPSTSFQLFSSFTNFLGFSVNKEKSFSSSHFRESCGVHYYDEIDCKPVYLKERPQSVGSYLRLANSIRLLAHRWCNNTSCDSRFMDCWSNIRSRLPDEVCLGIPNGFGDGGLICNFDEVCPSTKPRSGYSHSPRPSGRGFEGFRFKMFFEQGISLETDHPAIMMVRLKAISKSPYFTSPLLNPDLKTLSYKNNYTLRSKVKVKVLDDVLASQWYNLGPWCDCS